MKIFGKIVLFGAGAALGYYLANNKIDVELNVEQIVDKVKSKVNEAMGKTCGCENESCECGDDCCCEDEQENVSEDFAG